MIAEQRTLDAAAQPDAGSTGMPNRFLPTPVTDAHLSNPEILTRAADWLPPLAAGERT